MTITQRKQLEHRRIARAFSSDHQRKGTGTLGLFAIVLVCVIVVALFVVTR